MINLRKLRKQKNLTMKELGDILHLSESTISLYENGKREPDHSTIKQITDYFSVSADYLMGFSLDNKANAVQIPVLGVIPAGIPIEAVENVLDYEEISKDLAKTGTFFALKVRGDSMEPKLLEGDTIIVKQTNEAHSGDICVVMVNGSDATIKKIRIADNGLWLLPENPKYNAQFFDKKQIELLPVKIIGKAVEIRRGI